MQRSAESVAPANPAMGFCGLLSGVSDAVSAARLCVRALAIEREARNRNSPQPYLSWAAIRSWVFRRLDTEDVRSKPLLFWSNRATEATSLPSPALQRVRAICA